MIGFVALALIIMLDLGVAPESLVDYNRRRALFMNLLVRQQAGEWDALG